jgi:general secretion pathway protein D
MNKEALFGKLILIALIAGLALFQGCVAADVNKTKAEQFIADNNYDDAVEHYTKALQQHPDDLDLKLRLNDAKQRASFQHMTKAQELISKKYFKEAIEELQVSIAFYSSNHRAIELIDRVKKMKESFYYTQKGNTLIKLGDFETARKSFQRALELDPENEEAKLVLEKFKKRPEDQPEYRLDLKSDPPISLKFKDTPVLNVFEVLSKLAGVNFIFDKDLKYRNVTLFMTDVKFDKILDVILKTNSYRAKLINSKTMLVYQDTPEKAKEYDELYVKTFYLSYLKAPAAIEILNKILKDKDIIANEKLNSVTIRGRKENVELAGKIIEANDRTPSEVILNVEIMEVSKKKEQDLGLSISDTITFGVSETGTGIDFNPDFGFAGMASIKDISKITSRELYLSLPTATLKLLKKDGDTKVLAKPQLRVSSSEKATILIGEKVPLRSNRRIQTDGTTTYDFLYQDVGVKLTVEPVINMFNQVSLKLVIEISALGSNVGTVNDPQYSIKTRTTESVLTINDNDSVIIAGLIEDEDRTTVQKIPMFGDIPVMGRLFSSKSSDIIKTDILMSITPIIIRSQDIPEQNISEFWSGNEKEVSFQMPEEKRIQALTDFNEVPDEAYLAAITQDEFLPTRDYFSIQVYSSKDEADAQKKSKEISDMGHQTYIRPAEIKERGIYYRVFLGQYTSYQRAEDKRLELLTNDVFAKDIHIVDRDYVYNQSE